MPGAERAACVSGGLLGRLPAGDGKGDRREGGVMTAMDESTDRLIASADRVASHLESCLFGLAAQGHDLPEATRALVEYKAERGLKTADTP